VKKGSDSELLQQLTTGYQALHSKRSKGFATLPSLERIERRNRIPRWTYWAQLQNYCKTSSCTKCSR